jgi:hypothetical protein
MAPSPTAVLLAAALFMAATPACLRAGDVDAAKSGGDAKPEPRLIAGDAASSEFLRRLYGKPGVENGDVLLAAALMVDEAHFADDPKWALSVARAKRLVRGRGGPDLDARASRGFACQVFARALGIGGGLWQRVSNDSPRYAYQELFQLGLVPDGGGHLSITGDELAGLLQNAMRYRDVGPERPPGR